MMAFRNDDYVFESECLVIKRNTCLSGFLSFIQTPYLHFTP